MSSRQQNGHLFALSHLIPSGGTERSLSEPTEPIRTLARIRYRAERVTATVFAEPGARARVVFDQPQRSVTPGQAVVFYDGEYVVGGGTIDG